VIWGPFLLALALGLLVSAGLYFAYMWPHVEPEEPAPATGPELGSAVDQLASEADRAEPAAAERQEPADEEPQQPPPSVPA
jgi:hypothetical protein